MAAESGAEQKVLPFRPNALGGSPLLVRLLPSGRALLVGFAILGGALLAYLVARETPMFAVRSIVVEGAPPSVAVHVRRALEPLEGKSLLAVKSSSIERRLAALPDVASASYDRAFPHTLRLVIRAERPIAVARRGAEASLVSADARVIRAVPHESAPSLPRIWLPASSDTQSGAVIADGDALRALRALATARTLRLPARLRLARASDHELTLVLRSGLELRLADATDLRLKLAVAARVLPKLVHASPPYGYLDVSVPERPVAGR